MIIFDSKYYVLLFFEHISAMVVLCLPSSPSNPNIYNLILLSLPALIHNKIPSIPRPGNTCMVGPDAHFLPDSEFGIIFARVGKDAVFLGDAGDLPLLGNHINTSG